MSVLFINEENLPRVDALVVTEIGGADTVSCAPPVGECGDNAPATPTITVMPMEFMSIGGYAVECEVARFLTEVLKIATERGYTSVAMRFPAINNRRLIYKFSTARFMTVAAGFDIDIYIIVDDRQKRMMRASLDIDDEIEPVMYCRKISSSSVRPPIASCESAIPPETSSASVKPPKKSARPRPSAAKAEMIEGECCSILEDDFFDEPPSLADFIRDMDDTFAVRLLKLIDKKGMSEVECYKAANVSRQTWYKIMNEKDYRPSKNTVICFAISLHLTYDETQALLATAGFILSGSILFDKIIAYCIREGNYDIFSINAMLYSYDAECLGA